MANTYKPFNVSIFTDAITPIVHIPDITAIDAQLKPELKAEMVGHDIAPRHVALNASKPFASFESFSIAAILDAIGVSGSGILTVTGTGVGLNWQKFDSNSIAVSGSVHRQLLVKGGLIVPKTLTCNHQEDAKLTVEIHPLKTSVDPFVISDIFALPTITIVSARWTIGSIKIGNVALTGAVSLEIDFGNNVESRGSGSDVFDQQIEQKTYEPTIKITGIDPTWWVAAGITMNGKAVVHANDFIYLRKRDQTALNFVANATTEHIKFAFNGMAAVDQGIQAQAQKLGETGLMLKLARDAAGIAPLVVSTAVAHV